MRTLSASRTRNLHFSVIWVKAKTNEIEHIQGSQYQELSLTLEKGEFEHEKTSGTRLSNKSGKFCFSVEKNITQLSRDIIKTYKVSHDSVRFPNSINSYITFIARSQSNIRECIHEMKCLREMEQNIITLCSDKKNNNKNSKPWYKNC